MAVSSPPRPPAQDDPEALIPEARDRQRRRRLLALAAVAVTAAMGLGIYALATGGSPFRTARGAGTPANAAACRSSQISLFSGPGTPIIIGPLEGRQGLPIFENTSDTACSLPLRPPAARITWRGTSFAVQQKPGRGVIPGSWLPLRAVGVLRPGDKAAISVVWDNWCGPPHSYRPMTTIHLRFDRWLTVAAPLGPRPSCTARGAPSIIRVSRPLRVR